MKWGKSTLLLLVAIFIVSFIFSSFKQTQRSKEVEEKKLKACSEQGDYDCDLISRFHDECFDSSYRTQYKIKDFYPGEYNQCVDKKVQQHLESLAK